MTRPRFFVGAAPTPKVGPNSNTDPACTVILRIGGHRRRLTPAEAKELSRKLAEAAEAGEALEAATWSL